MGKKRKRDIRSKYDWDKWFEQLEKKGSIKLMQGPRKDYNCETISIYRQVRSQASARGITVSCQTLENPAGLKVFQLED